MKLEKVILGSIQVNTLELWEEHVWTILVPKGSAAETVEGSALSLESVDDVDSGDGLSLGVLSVGDGVPDHVLEEGSENESGLVVDEGADSLDTASSGESPDSWLGDTHDGGLERLLGESLSTALASDFAELAALALVSWSHFVNRL